MNAWEKYSCVIWCIFCFTHPYTIEVCGQFNIWEQNKADTACCVPVAWMYKDVPGMCSSPSAAHLAGLPSLGDSVWWRGRQRVGGVCGSRCSKAFRLLWARQPAWAGCAGFMYGRQCRCRTWKCFIPAWAATRITVPALKWSVGLLHVCYFWCHKVRKNASWSVLWWNHLDLLQQTWPCLNGASYSEESIFTEQVVYFYTTE